MSHVSITGAVPGDKRPEADDEYKGR